MSETNMCTECYLGKRAGTGVKSRIVNELGLTCFGSEVKRDETYSGSGRVTHTVVTACPLYNQLEEHLASAGLGEGTQAFFIESLLNGRIDESIPLATVIDMVIANKDNEDYRVEPFFDEWGDSVDVELVLTGANQATPETL